MVMDDNEPREAPVWPSLERAARAWARSKGLDEDEFVAWLKREAVKGRTTAKLKKPGPTHASESHPDD